MHIYSSWMPTLALLLDGQFVGPHCAQRASCLDCCMLGPAQMVEYWTYALFFCVAELWGPIVISVLFWTLANEVCTVQDARTIYPLMGIAANIALVVAGVFIKHVTAAVPQARVTSLASHCVQFKVSSCDQAAVHPSAILYKPRDRAAGVGAQAGMALQVLMGAVLLLTGNGRCGNPVHHALTALHLLHLLPGCGGERAGGGGAAGADGRGAAADGRHGGHQGVHGPPRGRRRARRAAQGRPGRQAPREVRPLLSPLPAFGTRGSCERWASTCAEQVRSSLRHQSGKHRRPRMCC